MMYRGVDVDLAAARIEAAGLQGEALLLWRLAAIAAVGLRHQLVFPAVAAGIERAVNLYPDKPYEIAAHRSVTGGGS